MAENWVTLSMAKDAYGIVFGPLKLMGVYERFEVRNSGGESQKLRKLYRNRVIHRQAEQIPTA